MKPVVLCTEFIAVVVLQKGSGEKRWWKKGRGEEDREEKGSGNETIHRAGVIVPAAAPQNKHSKSYQKGK